MAREGLCIYSDRFACPSVSVSGNKVATGARSIDVSAHSAKNIHTMVPRDFRSHTPPCPSALLPLQSSREDDPHCLSSPCKSRPYLLASVCHSPISPQPKIPPSSPAPPLPPCLLNTIPSLRYEIPSPTLARPGHFPLSQDLQCLTS